MSNADQLSALERLTKLREGGALTEEEFTAQKTAILAGVTSSTASHVPFYRRLWVVVTLTCLILTFWVSLIILATGNVYRRAKDGSLTPIKKTARNVYAGLLALWVVALVVKAIIDPTSLKQDWINSAPSPQASSGAPQSGQPAAQTASKDSSVQTASSSDDWALNNAGNALDGDAYVATKSFQFPDQKSRIDVSLTCTLKTKDVKIKIESYNDTPENGANAGNALVTKMDSNFKAQPVGRIKIGNAEPAPLSVYFSVDSYSNVVSWDILGFARLDWEQRAVSEAAYEASVDKIGAGNYLSANLPLIIEIQNEGGTEQLTIQKNSNSVNNVIEKCSSKDSPAFNSATSAPEPATPAGSVQQTAPVPDADTQGGTPTEPPQPTSP